MFFLPSPQLGGLNTSVSSLILDPKSLTTATNIIYDHIGSRKKRGGSLYLNESSFTEVSGSNTVMGIFDFKKTSTTGTETRKLVCHADGKIYKMDSYDGTWDNISSGPLTIDKQADYAVLRQSDSDEDVLIMVNGAEKPQIWNQTDNTVDDLTGTPSYLGTDFFPSCIIVHQRRLWAAGVPSYPYRVFFSAGNKYNDWNTTDDAGYIDIIDSHGSKVVGLASYYGYLVVFTENSIFTISGSSPDPTSSNAFAGSILIDEIGAVNQACIVHYGNDLYFVSNKGIHSLITTEKYGNILTTYISIPIQKDFYDLNPNYLSKSCGAAFEELNYIIWSFTTSGGNTTNNVCYLYDVVGNRWSKWTGINASSFAVVYSNTNKRELLAGNYDGFVNRLNRSVYNDNDTAYTMTWTTPYINFGDPIQQKNFRELFVFMKPFGNSDLEVVYRIDNTTSDSVTFSQAGTGAVLGSFTLGSDTLGGGTLATKSKSLTGSGRTIQFTFTQETSHASEVYGFAPEFIKEETDYSN